MSNKTDRPIRRYILDHCNVKAVIRLPQDAFKMSEGAACTSLLFAVKKNPDVPGGNSQGDIFFARAETIGMSPSGKPIPANDLLVIREEYQKFVAGEWHGIEVESTDDGGMKFIRSQPDHDEPWLEPTVNRTSVLYDRLGYVVRNPKIEDRFSYTYFHPSYYHTMESMQRMGNKLVPLKELCVASYPTRGRKPTEETSDGIPVLKVRNVTGRSIDTDTEYVADTDENRETHAKAIVRQDDILITSTGEGTIGRVDRYMYRESAIADGHVTIVRLKSGIDVQYVVEFLRSEFGQVQMLRYVSGSTGQTELLVEHVSGLVVPMPSIATQEKIVSEMLQARSDAQKLRSQSAELEQESSRVLAVAHRQMMDYLQ